MRFLWRPTLIVLTAVPLVLAAAVLWWRWTDHPGSLYLVWLALKATVTSKIVIKALLFVALATALAVRAAYGRLSKQAEHGTRDERPDHDPDRHLGPGVVRQDDP